MERSADFLQPDSITGVYVTTCSGDKITSVFFLQHVVSISCSQACSMGIDCSLSRGMVAVNFLGTRGSHRFFRFGCVYSLLKLRQSFIMARQFLQSGG